MGQVKSKYGKDSESDSAINSVLSKANNVINKVKNSLPKKKVQSKAEKTIKEDKKEEKKEKALKPQLHPTQMTQKKRERVCIAKELSLSQNETNPQELKNYVPPGDLSKTSVDPKTKIDLEKKMNPYYDGKEQPKVGSNPDVAKELQDESQETGGKFADRIAEDNKRELVQKNMTTAQIESESATNLYKNDPVFDPMSNSQIENVLIWKEAMTKKYKEGDKETEIKMGGNTTHQNFLLVYHPQCSHCQSMREDWVKLSQKIQQNKLPLNILAVNDGNKEYKKVLPGNLNIEYYPYILLLKNDKDQSVVEFNSDKEGEKEKQFDYNLTGFENFLKANAIQGI